VRYYYLFRDHANDKITKDSAIKKLVNEGISNEEGASIRLGNAKIIFSEKGNCEALLIVQNSKRLSDEIISTATAILARDCRRLQKAFVVLLPSRDVTGETSLRPQCAK